jgi:hypothetical protein
MKHRVTWLSVLPLALAMINLAEAGIRCGGCSDPCRPTRSHAFANARSCGIGGGSGYAGYSVVEASPASCGAVTADGSYGMSNGMSYGAMANAAPMAGCNSVQATVVMQSAPQSVMQSPAMVAPQFVCEPITGYRTVMESTFVTETQYVNAMETKQETRTRVKKVSKSVPVTVDDFRTKTVLVPTTETKTIEYTVLVPEQSTKTVDVTVTVPVWNEVSENYTVKVPTIGDVTETYNVNVARLKDESFTYTVYAPQTETMTKVQTVTNAVPVVKTRTVQRTVPSYSTQSVTKDYGHWETVVEEVAGSSFGAAPAVSYAAPAMVTSNGCGNAAMATTAVSGGGCGNGIFAGQSRACGCSKKSNGCGCGSPVASSCGCSAPVQSACGSSTGCGSGCGGNMIVNGNVVNSGSIVGGCNTGTMVAYAPTTMTTTRRVWVPSVVTEEVPVVTNTVQNEEVAYTVYEQQSTQVPYECAYIVYRPEQRTGTKKVVEYVSEPRTRTRKVVSYTDEQRTRTRRVLSYTTQTKQETYPVVTYKTEKQSKEISFTVNVPTQSVEAFQTTRYETITEDVVEEYVANVQVPTTKEVQVQVCKMVPKLVPYTFNPCSNAATTNGYSTNGSTTNGSSGCGCGSAAPAMNATSGVNCGCGASTMAPAQCSCAK